MREVLAEEEDTGETEVKIPCFFAVLLAWSIKTCRSVGGDQEPENKRGIPFSSI